MTRPDVDPWDRDGVMSDPDRVRTFEAGSIWESTGAASAAPTDRTVKTGAALVLAAMVVIAAAAAIVASRDSDETATAPATTSAPAVSATATLPEIESPELQTEALRSETAVGTITWTKISGDPSSLPTTVTGFDGVAFNGDEFEEFNAWGSADGRSWARRDGPVPSAGATIEPRPETFVNRPWPAEAVLDSALVPTGVLVLASLPGPREIALWFTTDGATWTSAPLPAPIIDGTPMPTFADNDEVILSIYTNSGPRFWATADGLNCESLPDVPGIAHRSSGDFGWVAPHPRSAPTIQVSPDGVGWAEVDLRELLGVDASYWDLSIDARAIDSTIFVSAVRQDERVLLIGAVDV